MLTNPGGSRKQGDGSVPRVERGSVRSFQSFRASAPRVHALLERIPVGLLAAGIRARSGRGGAAAEEVLKGVDAVREVERAVVVRVGGIRALGALRSDEKAPEGVDRI